jgi:alpha-L-fucosidase
LREDLKEKAGGSDREATREEMVMNGIHNHSSEDEYVIPKDPLLLERLEWFRDQKLGLMMHWGPYSQIGVIESWALSDYDADWSRSGIDWEENGEEFKRHYFNLNRTFNPIRFQPELWAELAGEGGFRYLVFTTKHHDGFCMWDTHTTDYSVTGKECPFHRNKNADICKQLFDAFRAEGISIAAYFSKADWHSPYYWATGMTRGTNMWRGPSYDPGKYPWLWKKFVEFTHEQILELITNYGRIDMLWLDAGWVAEQSGEDIRLGEVIAKARELQPWLIAVNRAVGGPYENYITPEQMIPEKPMSVPWESNITMGTSYSFKYEDEYKTARQLLHMLIDVVAKGGNLILNVGPQPDGRLPATAVSRIKKIGAWMKKYGEGIYGTRVCKPYSKGNFAFTRKDNAVYCFLKYESDRTPVNTTVRIPYEGKVREVTLMGYPGKLDCDPDAGGVTVKLPDGAITGETPIAHVFCIR